MSIKVIIIKDKPIGQIVLNKDLTTIGRKSDCDISLKDPAVSGLHAQIKVVGEHYLLEDLDSTNGVGFEGRKIKQHMLKNDDVVTIGEHQLKFLIQASKKTNTRLTPEVQKVPAAQPGIVKASHVTPEVKQKPDITRVPDVTRVPDTVKVALEGEAALEIRTPAIEEGSNVPKTDISKPVTEIRSARPGSESNGAAGGYLEVLNGPRPGKRIILRDGLTTIGEPGIQMAAVSRRPAGHFIIHVDGGKDKDKTPMVNDEPTGFKSRRLEPGDKIEVAGIRMEYHRD